ncbi:hypothetical protein EV356DRAFT_507031 [Viridothelium virens]|uniref:Uncharacterized protein n=1 Tax=Viridothelium virens TaxID=1048519 RepID=A0A6A6H0P5_VIRVR|nr:hypothetical protein EV356DRAFT_507031 [Viridothelium virens]
MSAGTTSRDSLPASASTSPTPTSGSSSPSALTTPLLVLIAPSQTFNGSVITANSASTVYLINFPDSNALGTSANATVTVGPSSASSGSYAATLSVPNTGFVTASCNTTGSASPTACELTLTPKGLTLTTNTVPSHTVLPVTITGGLEKLSAASTVSVASSSSSTGVAPGLAAEAQYGNGLGLMALVGMFLGRWLL